MAAAMARGWAGARGGPEAMTFADAGSGRAAELANEVGGDAVRSLEELPERSDAIVLAVKRTALDEVAADLANPPLLISVLAGVPVDRLRERFPGVPVLRVMPNLAVEVRKGTLVYVRPTDDLRGETRDRLLELLGLLGTMVAVAEKEIDAAMAVMSCSPAYLALVSETLATAAERQGLDAKLAHELVVDALAGTAGLLRARDPQSVRAAVASPGGATEAGLEALERGGFASALEQAVETSLQRMRQ
jgi:pyrroline-5-carboxylate reductase